MSVDEKWMRRALLLARRGQKHAHPNPMVGAVLVRDGKVVGEGFHRRYGGDHAEVEAIRRAGTRAAGSTLYVNLEPCAHWGKTPPCARAVAAAGVQRVVAAMRDPNPLVSGKGFSFLKKKKIKIVSGVLEREARHLNRGFISRMTIGRPYITLKAACSLDGRASTVTGESKWITGNAARKVGWTLRSEANAIAVGANTVLRDNPTLTAHGTGTNPVRIVFAGRRKLPRRAHVFNKAAPTWVLKNTQGKTNLRRALRDLAGRGITHLLVEGGPTLANSFLEAGVVDEVVWFIAPMIIGGARRLRQSTRLRNVRMTSVGSDWVIRGEACLPASSKRPAK